VLELRMLTGLPPAEAAAQIRRADVVVDQVLLGLYGVLACEAMACGRLVLGHLGEPLRSRVGQPVPVVEADPRTLAQVMEWVLDDRAAAREHAATGRAFVEEVHDGRLSAAVLAPFLGRAAPMEVARVPPSRKQTKGVPGS
jgi:glycosyltransferase involved in cell wall biosynthesis